MENTINLKLDTCLKLSYFGKMAYPEECCGLLVGSGREFNVNKAFFLENISKNEERATSFLIDPKELLNIENNIDDENESIIGVFHSHPDAEASLSGEDEENMIPGIVYIILSIVDEKCRDIKAYLKEEPGKRASTIPLCYVR